MNESREPMSDILPIPTAAQIKAALAVDGRQVSNEQAAALAQLIGTLGGVDRARIAVEILADLEDAA
jgi:hypothetical protein